MKNREFIKIRRSRKIYDMLGLNYGDPLYFIDGEWQIGDYGRISRYSDESKSLNYSKFILNVLNKYKGRIKLYDNYYGGNFIFIEGRTSIIGCPKYNTILLHMSNDQLFDIGCNSDGWTYWYDIITSRKLMKELENGYDYYNANSFFNECYDDDWTDPNEEDYAEWLCTSMNDDSNADAEANA